MLKLQRLVTVPRMRSALESDAPARLFGRIRHKGKPSQIPKELFSKYLSTREAGNETFKCIVLSPKIAARNTSRERNFVNV